VGFSFGYAVDVRGRDAVGIRNATDGWYPAIEVREVSAHPSTELSVWRWSLFSPDSVNMLGNPGTATVVK